MGRIRNDGCLRGLKQKSFENVGISLKIPTIDRAHVLPEGNYQPHIKMGMSSVSKECLRVGGIFLICVCIFWYILPKCLKSRKKQTNEKADIFFYNVFKAKLNSINCWPLVYCKKVKISLHLNILALLYFFMILLEFLELTSTNFFLLKDSKDC